MTLGDVLDQLEALGNLPLKPGHMHYDGRFCAAAHMLRIVGAWNRDWENDRLSNPAYPAFEQVFGIGAEEVFDHVDHIHSTAASAAVALRTHLVPHLNNVVANGDVPASN